MNTDLQKQLKQLSKTARAERLAGEAAAEQQRQARAEASDFTAAMAGVIPLKPRNQIARQQDHSPIKIRTPQAEALAETDYFFVGDQHALTPPDEFCKNGRGIDDIRRLQNKYWPVVGYVDLHGCRQDEAQNILNEFIDYVQQRGVCGEIIHGSGLGSKANRPVLKNLVRRWLMAHPQVLAYAQPNAHNDGAVLILLKQRRMPTIGKYNSINR